MFEQRTIRRSTLLSNQAPKLSLWDVWLSFPLLGVRLNVISPASGTRNGNLHRFLTSVKFVGRPSMACNNCNAQISPLNMELVQLNINWEDVFCPICLDFPHNGVLLHCTSYENGCRPFMCDTDHTHSNCLDRFKMAHGMSTIKELSTPGTTSVQGIQSVELHGDVRPTCPLCRGEVTGWVVVDEARMHFNKKKRCCEEEQCAYVGNYLELQCHAKLKHPHARPSKIDPARQLDWENFQQSSEIIDVLSTIHSEVPHGVVLGDYVIEYGENEIHDEYDDFHGDEGNWWTSCILYQVFDNFRSSRNRRRSRAIGTRGRHRSGSDASNSDEGSVTSVEIAEYTVDDMDDEFFSSSDPSRGGSTQRSRRRRSRFYDH